MGQELVSIHNDHDLVRNILTVVNRIIGAERRVSVKIGFDCRELSNRLMNHDVPEVLIDKRKGQQQDFRVNLEVKAELIQNFAARAISGYSVSSQVLAEVINEHQEISISSRTIRWHMNKLGLMKIKKTLPDLVKALKKSPESST